MTSIDDWIDDYEFNESPFGEPDPFRSDPLWKMKNGDYIAVSKMTDRHIQNCMKLVGEDSSWYCVFEEELERRKNG